MYHQKIKSKVITQKRHRKNLDYTSIAYRLGTVSCSNYCHPTGVVKPVHEIDPSLPTGVYVLNDIRSYVTISVFTKILVGCLYKWKLIKSSYFLQSFCRIRCNMNDELVYQNPQTQSCLRQTPTCMSNWYKTELCQNQHSGFASDKVTANLKIKNVNNCAKISIQGSLRTK